MWKLSVRIEKKRLRGNTEPHINQEQEQCYCQPTGYKIVWKLTVRNIKENIDNYTCGVQWGEWEHRLYPVNH
jgi:hypothetical protein